MLQHFRRHPVLSIIAILIGLMIAYRAWIIPFTHDEASTYLNYRHLNVWTCMTNSFCWGTANNHWLNTMLLQISANLFGEEPFALRLPSVIGGWFFLVAVMMMVTRYLHHPALRIGAFLVLTCHFYLLDFFSLARGYGLMISGIMWALYALMRYTAELERRWLLVMLLSIFLAVLSNFLALVPLVSLAGCWIVLIFWKEKFTLLWRHGGWWLLLGAVLYILLRFPLGLLSTAGEFEWGADTLRLMGRDAVYHLLAHQGYFSGLTIQITLDVCLVGFLIGTILCVVHRKKFPATVLFVAFTWLTLIGFMFLRSEFNVLYPVSRKAVFLIPVFFGCMIFPLGLVRKSGTSWALGMLMTVVVINHFIRVAPTHINMSSEWYFDAHYEPLLKDLFPNGAGSDSVRLGASWIFYPSLMYYREIHRLPFSGLEYQKTLQIDTTLQYYYLDPGDTTGVNNKGFEVYKKYSHFLLFKREETILRDTTLH